MSLFSTAWNKLKEVLQKMVGAKTVESVLQITPAISDDMANAIQLWGAMYMGEAPWLHSPTVDDPVSIQSLGLPALIASEKARTALLEFESEITTPMVEDEKPNPDYQPTKIDDFGNEIPSGMSETLVEEVPTGDTARAEFLNKHYKKLKRNLRRQIEYGIAKGGLVVKPYVVKNDAIDSNSGAEEGVEVTVQQANKEPYILEFDYVQADGFFPLAFDASGRMTEAAFVQRKLDKDTTYSRLEYHKYKNNSVTVVNKAFKTTKNISSRTFVNEDELGKEIPLSDVPEWADIAPKAVINNVDRLMFAYFRMPESNTVDTYSNLGVSGYSKAVNLIKDADMQYSRLLWEYEGGELAINIDRDAFRWKEDSDIYNGHSELPMMQQRLYRQLDVNNEELLQPYSPALRDASYMQGLNTILMRIEDVTGLSRGTISDASAEARTATEIRILKQRSYQTNADIQQAIEDMLNDVIYIMNAYCDLYKITPPGPYEASFEWDDSILVDVETELGKRITLMQNGLASKVETRMWYFGETEQQAKEALAKIDEENQEAVEQNLVTQMQMSNIANQQGQEEE